MESTLNRLTLNKAGALADETLATNLLLSEDLHLAMRRSGERINPSRYVRELGVLSLEECVEHLTGRAAKRLRLTDRGLVREGYAADLVLFDAATIADTATFDEPRQQAAGIPYVFCNGVPVIDDGTATGALPGHSLRSRP